jgi:hypothetical protein
MLKKLAPLLTLLAVTIGAASPLPVEAAGWLRIFLGVTPGPPAPAITVVSPNSGTEGGGTSVVIQGTGLSGATAVSFSACGAAASFVVNGPSQITAVSPSCSPQTVDIRVTTPVSVSPITGSCPTAPCDQYTFNSPSVPSWVPFVGGQVASLYENFETGQYWYSGAVQASPAQSVTRTGSKVCPDFTTASANTACIGSYGLSVTQGFTNLILQSSNYETTPWATGAVYDPTFATTTTAPDGTNTARLFTEDGTNNYHQVAQGFTKAGSNITYSACVYFKASTDNAFYISVDNGSPSYQGIITVFQGTNTANLTPASGWTFISSSVTASLNGFSLAQLTFTSDTTTSNRFIIGLNDNYGGFLGSYAGTAGQGLYIWGAGLYQGETCPPAIQTTTATVSTNVDVVALTSPASTLLASTNAAVQVVTQGASNVASTIIDANGTVLLGENSGAACVTNVGATLASPSPANWINAVTCSLSWISGTSGTINLSLFTTSDSSVTRNPSGTFHLGSTSGSSAFLDGNIQSIAIYSPSVTFPTYVPVAYYFDSVGGSDTANCQSTSTACQSITKINSLSYHGGDQILLKAGDTFLGCLSITSSNASPNSASPLVVTSYSTGAAPIIQGSGCANPGTTNFTHVALIDSVQGVTWNGVNVNNGGEETNACIQISDNNNVPNAGYITIENSNLTGCYQANGDQYTSGEIVVFGFGSNCNALTNISILNNTLHGASVGAPDRNGVTGFGCIPGNVQGSVQGNLVYDMGGTASSIGGGMILNGWINTTLQFNLVHDTGYNVTTGGGGTVGIWTAGTSACTFQFNESYNQQNSTGNASGTNDFDGFDWDLNTLNCLGQYLYSHNNMGYGLIFFEGSESGGTWDNNVYRYVISENDNFRTTDWTAGIINAYPVDSSKHIQVYKATVWSNLNGQSLANGTVQASAWNFEAQASGSLVINNIWAVTQGAFGITGMGSCFSTNITTASYPVFKNNDYYSINGGTQRWYQCGSGGASYSGLSAWQAVAPGGETASITSNPSFSSPPSGDCTWNPNAISTWPPSGCPAAYSSVSTAIKSAGLDLTQAPYSLSVGTRDYYDTTIPGTGSCYNMGAYGVCP